MSLFVIILAAGKGSRMKSSLPKAAHEVAGKPMLQWVVDAAASLAPEIISVVHGHLGDELMSLVPDRGLLWAKQSEQLGTGHAVKVALEALGESQADKVLVLLGDMPLIKPQSLESLLSSLESNELGLLSTVVDDPFGLGRIIRGEDGFVKEIVEHKDADVWQKEINEINTGAMVFPAQSLAKWINKIGNNNKSKEYYLTDVISLAVAEGFKVVAKIIDKDEAYGINSRADLAKAERCMQDRIVAKIMDSGVRVYDPYRCDIRGELSCGQDVTIDINCVFEGKVELGDNVHIGPNCVIKDSKIGSNTIIKANSVIDDAIIGKGCTVGPFARVRSGTNLHDSAKLGNFVETKNAYIGAKSKINHLSYIGDASIGVGTNVGAGTITCNYDGIKKHLTKVGDKAFIGSGCQLVAPVQVGDGAVVGAGTTLMQDAPSNKLTINAKTQLCKDSLAISRLQEKKERTT